MSTKYENFIAATNPSPESKIAWQRPAIDYIDIKRTMTGFGSLSDFVNTANAANSVPS